MIATFAFEQLSPAEFSAAIFGISLILGMAAFGVVRWLNSGPVQPDPWEGQNLELPETLGETILCHRCLVPNDSSVDFCENCGATIGAYTNYMPFTYLFSVGDMLRLGTSGRFRRTRMAVLGFVLLSVAEYSLFFPIYLYQFFRRNKVVACATPTRSNWHPLSGPGG